MDSSNCSFRLGNLWLSEEFTMKTLKYHKIKVKSNEAKLYDLDDNLIDTITTKNIKNWLKGMRRRYEKVE